MVTGGNWHNGDMYRDLSALLAMKEIELTEAREKLGELERLLAGKDERIAKLEKQIATMAESDNVDDVRRNLGVLNNELTSENRELRRRVSWLESETARLKHVVTSRATPAFWDALLDRVLRR
jgi:predicted  nucleic acid-binding Zn-ribbon protein